MTDQLKQKGRLYFGHDLTYGELRLLPYVHFCAMNQKTIDRQKVSESERQFLKGGMRQDMQCAIPGMLRLNCQKGFMNEILWESYISQVDVDGD